MVEYPVKSPDSRVLMLLNRYLPVVGGTERQAAALAGELKRRGYPISILTRRIKADYASSEKINGIPVRRLSPVGLSHAANALMAGRILMYLVTHRHEYDILHIHGVGPLGLAGVLAASIVNKPVIIKSADYGNLSRQDHSGILPSFYSRVIRQILLPPWLWKRFIGSIDRLIAINDAIANEAVAMGLQDRVVRIPNGVDIDQHLPVNNAKKLQLRQQLGLPVEETLFVSAGRLVHRKRFDVILRALAQILDDYPNCNLVLAGSGSLQIDDTENALKALTESLGISHQVYFTGLVNNIDPYLQAADAFLFASEKEGMPNIVLEAMATGLPIIASQIDGVVQLLDDTSGWLVPPGDTAALAKMLRQLLAQPNLAQEKGQQARYIAEKRFSLQAVADQYEAVYASITRG